MQGGIGDERRVAGADSDMTEGIAGNSATPEAWAPISPEELYVAGLFDGVWYKQRNPDVGDGDALLHFIAVGDREHRRPSEWFDPDWYLSQLPAGLGQASGPVEHYMRLGAAAGLSILPPEAKGLPPNAAVADADIERASEMVLVDGEDPAPPSVAPQDWPPLTSLEVYHAGLFSADWYTERHSELIDHPDPLAHFVERGDQLGWSPSRLFDAAWYFDQIAGNLEGATGPLMHFLRLGKSRGLSPLPVGPVTELLAQSPIFDEVWYVRRYPEALESPWSPLAFFLVEGLASEHDPGPFFSSTWYRDQYSGRIPVTSPAFLHYILEGESAGFWPNAAFDPIAYELFRPSGTKSGQLERYLIHAETSGDWDHPGFNASFYVYDNPDVDFSITEAAIHFVQIGWLEARAPVASIESSGLKPAGVVTFGFLIDGYQADPRLIEETLKSLALQVRGVWRAWVNVERVTWKHVAVPGGIAERVSVIWSSDNRADRLGGMLDRFEGEYLVILDAGDTLEPGALGRLAKRLRHDRLDVLYTDERRMASTATEPAVMLKPDWSPELLTQYNYFGRLTAIRTETARAAGGFATAAGEAGEWDLALRIAEVSSKIARLPEILCTRSPTTDMDRPLPASGRAVDFRSVLARHWKRKGFDATVISRADGTMDARWPIDNPPKVSVIIPTRDKVDLLRRVIDGLREGTDYPALEIVVVDNLSEIPATLSYLGRLENEGVEVVRFTSAFNYSAACNAGAAAAHGELLLFLNNDVEIISADWLQHLVRMALRPGVGVVGTMLLYPGGELQHAGVALGIDMAGLVFRNCGRDQWTVYGSPAVARNWLAVMGACQLVRRETFDLVGGFDETYRIANSDVALCLRAWQAGYRTAYAPEGALVHHEGATRGRLNPPEDTLRAALDIHAMGFTEDPYYHPDLDPSVSIPTLRAYGVPDARSALSDAIARARIRVPSASRLDPTDVGRVADATGLPADRLKWSPHEAARVDDLWSAVRFIIDTLLTRRRLRETCVRPLSGGKDGPFALQVVADARDRLGLGDTALRHIASAFALDIGQRPGEVIRSDRDARWASPLGLTPAGLRESLKWLFRTGMSRHGLRREEIWWWALELGEHTDRALADTWRVTPEWQARVPDALTPLGADALSSWLGLIFDLDEPWSRSETLVAATPVSDQIRQAYHGREDWRRTHPDAFGDTRGTNAFLDWLESDSSGRRLLGALDPNDRRSVAEDLATPGVNLIGLFGEGNGNPMLPDLIKGIADAGLKVAQRLPGLVPAHPASSQRLGDLDMEIFDVSIMDLNPGETAAAFYDRCDLRPRQQTTYRIAYCDWSHDLVPAAWSEMAASIDEVWTTTRFAAERIRKRVGIPVHVLPPGIETPARAPASRARDEEPFVFFADAGESGDFERCNIIATIQAFRRAFPRGGQARLIIDISRLTVGSALDALRIEAGRAPVQFVGGNGSESERSALLMQAHAYVALPGTSGLDLGMLKAMRAGLVVVTLFHSGAMDIVREDTAALVNFTLANVPEETAGYTPGSIWAVPSISHAASTMKALASDRDHTWQLALAGQTSIGRDWSTHIRGAAMALRLGERPKGGIADRAKR